MAAKTQKTARYYIGLVLMVFFAILCVAPLIYMVLISFTDSQTLYIHMSDVHFGDFKNYIYLFVSRDFARPLLNSVIVVVLAVIAVNAVSCTMGYGFDKKPVPGKKFLFNVIVATMMIPTQVVFISLFVMMRKMNLMNTYIAMVIPLIGAFGIFLMRQFIHDVPTELMEAAEIDGCPEIGIFAKIVLPLINPAIVTLTVFTFNSAWNSFLWPLIITTKSRMYTLTVATSTLTSYFETNYGPVMAAATITFLVPFVLYLFLQKQFVEGIALGGVKG